LLRAIRNLDCSLDFRARNFAESSYTTQQNKQATEYIITRDGFVFLVMGFTGEQAAKFKEEYLAEFNRMEEQLRKESLENPLPVYTMRVLSEPTKSVPRGYWSVFDKSHAIMLLIESKIGCFNKYDLADGSIGIMWAKYRQGKFWATMEPGTYSHEYDDERGSIEGVKCYHSSELQYFDEWLMYTYKFEHLPKYLTNKYKNEGNQLMLEKVKTVLPTLLKSA
ncbi:MAG: hypothetical protein EOO10_25155, partial [Chitinophagaceae bacterium]